MGVYIKGMEMPKNCAECYLSKRRHSSLGDIVDCERIGTVGSAFNDPHLILIVRHPDCPLIEIKEPHGRLGDLDNIYVDGEGYFWFSENEAPTIIEAEE